MGNEHLLPPVVADLVLALRDQKNDAQYRDNVAARLEAIEQACSVAVREWNGQRDKAFSRRRR